MIQQNIMPWSLELRQAINEFAFEFLKTFLCRHQDEYSNLFISPFVLFTSLASMLAGAKNETQKQLSELLKLNDFNKSDKLCQELKDLVDVIVFGNVDSLFVGNFMYISTDAKIKKEFRTKIAKYFEVIVTEVAFKEKSVKDIVKQINSDILEATESVVDEVAVEDQVSQSANLLLVNAMFFRGYWNSGFKLLKSEDFLFCLGRKCVQLPVKMMVQTHVFNFVHDEKLKCKAIKIPYETTDLCMIIILPDEETDEGLKLVKSLDRSVFLRLSENMKPHLVEVKIPKFALDPNRIKIRGTLISMGAKDLFDNDKCDLSGISSEKKIHLDRIIHKSFIVVDERGSNIPHKENLTLDSPKKEYFIASHPFVFLILDEKEKFILFIGFFGDPKQTLEVLNESEMSPEEVQAIRLTCLKT